MTNKYRSLEHKALEILSGKKLLTNKQLTESRSLDLKEDAVTGKKRVVVTDPDKPDRRRVETTITGRLQFQTPARLAANKKRSEKAAAAKEEQKNQAVQESKEEFNKIIMEERKVSSQAANNFMNHRPYKNKNTKVIVTPEQTELYLHGNLIAKNSKKHGVSVSMAGWPTVTTKSRLNSLGAKIKTRGGRHYMGSKEVDAKAWMKLNENQKIMEGRIKELLTKDEEDDITPEEQKRLYSLRAAAERQKWEKAIAPVIDKINKTDWSNSAVDRIRKKDPKYQAYLKKKGKLAESDTSLTEKSLIKEEVEGLARTLSRGKEELPKMQDHRLKGQFSKNLLEAVQKVMAEKKTVFKDSFAEGLGNRVLKESAKQYGALLKKWKTAKGSEKAALKKKMDAIKANSKVTAKAPAPKSVPKVSVGKKQSYSDESTYLDKVLKGQFPWGNVGKETAKAFRSKLMTIQKPRDRELAMKHAMKSADHLDQVMSGKALKEENGELMELHGKGSIAKILPSAIDQANELFYKQQKGMKVGKLRAAEYKAKRAHGLELVSDSDPDKREHRGRKYWLNKSKNWRKSQKKWEQRGS